MSTATTHIKKKKQLVPALRFKEFDGDWKMTKLLDFAPLQRGFDLPVVQIQEGPYPVVFSNGALKTHSEFKVKAPGVVTGRSGTIGKVTFVEEDYWPHNTALWVTNFYENDPKYVYYFYINIKLDRYGTGSGVPTLNRNDVHAQKRATPSLPEQQKIASFLSAVDEKIQQLTKKKALLEDYKKGVMQQLFSGKLRFKDANGKNYPDWEEKKMVDIMAVRNDQAPKSDEYPLMAFIKHIGVAPKGDRYNREFLVNDGDGKKYKKTEYGDFIYSSNNLDTGSIGLNRYGSACISPVYSIFQIKELCDYQFISKFLVRKSFINKMLRFRQGVVYGQWKIHETAVLTIKEKIPCLEEQQKIASYLSRIDTKIEAVNHQITQTQTFKKGLLQQMFV